MTVKQYIKMLEFQGKPYYNIKRRSDGFSVCQVYGKYTADEILNELNALHEENEQLKSKLGQFDKDCEYYAFKLEKENERLKKVNQSFAKSNSEGIEKIQKLAKENEQLKEVVVSWSTSYNRVYEENEQLKFEINMLKAAIVRNSDVDEHCLICL